MDNYECSCRNVNGGVAREYGFPFFSELKVYVDHRLDVPFWLMHMDRKLDGVAFAWFRAFSTPGDVCVQPLCKVDENVRFIADHIGDMTFKLSDACEEILLRHTCSTLTRRVAANAPAILDTRDVIRKFVSLLGKLKYREEKYGLVWYCCHIDPLATADALVATPDALDMFSWTGLCAAEFMLNGMHVDAHKRLSGASHALRNGLVSRHAARHWIDQVSRLWQASIAEDDSWKYLRFGNMTAVSTISVGVHWKVLTCTGLEQLFFAHPSFPFASALVSLCCDTTEQLQQIVDETRPATAARFAVRCLEDRPEAERSRIQSKMFHSDFVELGMAIVQFDLPPYICESIVRFVLGTERTQLVPFGRTSSILCNIHDRWRARKACAD